MRRQGFTLIELVMVVLIICLLIALLVPVVVQLRRGARIASTNLLIEQVAHAITKYLDRYPVLGEDPTPDNSTFTASPWTYLHRNWRTDLKEAPLLEMQLKQLAVGNGPYRMATTEMEADQILDHFPMAAQNALRFQVTNAQVANSHWATTAVRIYSTMGASTISDKSIVWEYTSDSGEFRAIVTGH